MKKIKIAIKLLPDSLALVLKVNRSMELHLEQKISSSLPRDFRRLARQVATKCAIDGVQCCPVLY